MKVIKGNWIMEKDEIIEEDLKVEGSILGKDGRRFNLIVRGDIDAEDINARDIDAWNINAGNIDAEDINVRNINAEDINARNINAEDINARDINVRNIDAWNIDYWAVCFAYRNIKCKSIKGRRENSRHFVLDGEIEVGGQR
jgi:hypothetical protein